MMRGLAIVALAAAPASAGVLDLDLGAQATTTAWAGDRGGGAAFDAGWWFAPWLGASFVGKEQYATINDRLLSYFSVNAMTRQYAGPIWLTESLGVVHQHEESRAVWMDQYLGSALGVADGIRHRSAARAGLSIAMPVARHLRGDMYVSIDLDGTYFTDTDKGPRWMASAGLSAGLTFDLAARPR